MKWSWSWKFARVAGIELKLHATFVLIVAFGAAQWGDFGAEGAVFGAALTLLTFASVLLHELGHSLVALAFGIPVKDITLYPVGGVARLDRPKTAVQEFVVAIAGPAVNVVLVALIGALGVWLYDVEALKNAMFHAQRETPSTVTLIAMLISSNAVLAVFNMVPALPMDGGRVLRAVLSGPLGPEKATWVSAIIARVLAVALFAASILIRNPMLAIMAVIVFFGAGEEVKQQRLAYILEGVEVGDAINPDAPTFSPDTTFLDVIGALKSTKWDAFMVQHAGRFVGVVTREGLTRGMSKEGATGYVTSVMQREVPRIDASERLEAARVRMEASGLMYLAVVRDNVMLGLITDLELATTAERLMKQVFDGRRDRGAGRGKRVES